MKIVKNKMFDKLEYDQLFSHFNFNYFQCGYKNCHAKFSSELQVVLHCQTKHCDSQKVNCCLVL